MSLLLDALKRAEEAKRAKLSVESVPSAVDTGENSAFAPGPQSTTESRRDESGAASSESPDFVLEDYKEVIPAKRAVHGLVAAKYVADVAQGESELSLESFPGAKLAEPTGRKGTLASATMATPATQSRLDATSDDAAHSRDVARNVFVAKQATTPDSASRKKWLLPVIAGVLLAVGAGGWYVWNEVNRMSRPGAGNVAARPVPGAALGPAQPGTGQPGARQPDENASRSATPVETPLPPLLPPAAEQVPLPKLTQRTPATTIIPVTEREALAKSLKDAPVSKDAPVELKLAQSVQSPAVNADLIDAYAALRNSDYQRAHTLYAKLVQVDPLSTDAQLGIATAFARSGDSAAAARHYRQVLVIDPRNGTALAGLLAVSDARLPALEVELRTFVGRYPEVSSLRFTLGNLYASERRWVEAQQAYFEAYRLESDNADYMYNLAVSLDQLKQAKLAQEYYQKALVARSKAGGQFDPAAVASRIKALSVESIAK